ncbi:MAG: phenylalanine--tRNA ligase beta subunit-related protein [Planctomycetota bacterium]
MQSHPLLELAAFVARFPQPLGEIESPAELLQQLDVDAHSRFEPLDEAKQLVRDLLRHGGYKPTGRGKPASEYLIKAVSDNKLGSINLVVDACNVVSLHSRLPISVVDLDKTEGALEVAIAPENSTYVFNQSGQEIKVDGLICLFDALGPCANGVKDSQRTKTSDKTVRTLSIVWGTTQIRGRAGAAAAWYKEILEKGGASVDEVQLVMED